MSKHRSRFRRQGTAVAIGLPGKSPSPQARHLAASPVRLPVGAWHVSDYASADLARADIVIVKAWHSPTGAAFRLATAPHGSIVAVEVVTVAAEKLLSAHGSDDPTKWANQQAWAIEPPHQGTGI